MHGHRGQLALCVAQQLQRVDKRGSRDVGSRAGTAGDIQNMIFQRGNGFGVFGITAEYTAQQIDQFFLHFAGPVTGHQTTDGFHGIRTGQGGVQDEHLPDFRRHRQNVCRQDFVLRIAVQAQLRRQLVSPVGTFTRNAVIILAKMAGHVRINVLHLIPVGAFVVRDRDLSGHRHGVPVHVLLQKPFT